MLIRIGNLEFTISLRGQGPGELIVNDGTLLVEFNANLLASAQNATNEARKKRMSKWHKIDSIPYAASAAIRQGRKREFIPLTLQTKFEVLRAIKPIYAEAKENTQLRYRMPKSINVKSAIKNKNSNTALIAVSTTVNASCVAVIIDEDEKALALAGDLESKYKQWTMFQCNDLFLFLRDLFDNHGDSFSGFCSVNSTFLQVQPDVSPAIFSAGEHPLSSSQFGLLAPPSRDEKEGKRSLPEYKRPVNTPK